MPSHTAEEQARRKAIARIMEALAGQGVDPNAAFQAMPGLLSASLGEQDPAAQPELGARLVALKRQQAAFQEPARQRAMQRVSPGAPVVPRGGLGFDKRFDRLFGALQIAELQAAGQGKDFRLNPSVFGLGETGGLVERLPLERPQIGASVTGGQRGASVTGDQRGAAVTGLTDAPAQSARGGQGAPPGAVPFHPEEEARLRQALVEQAEAAARAQAAQAQQATTQARLADPLEAAKAAATTQQFGLRRDVGAVLPGEAAPRPVRGLRRITEGEGKTLSGVRLTDERMPITSLREQAEIVRDPNFADAQRFQFQQMLTQGSPGVSQALVQQQTARLRDEAAAARQAAGDAAALARIETQQAGAAGRAQLSAGTQQAIAAARERINLLRARTEASRYDSTLMGFGGLSDETERLLREAEAELERLQRAPVTPTAPPSTAKPKFELVP